ncbi:16S ribosomal RNA methyltransferase KsgA/Dim1 family protein [Holospora obtusa F1]|uniref:16S ribosomal RNA methyltransferase KsgA/Dim1 family protein n=2 Tax=Holospora obtusa TaxID=49893 RepID=W6TGK2_HOLOB|nr:16S ribosomal RNA methyltransferase KsgA/Dim1 family protein [Holospora obtusa F1]
MANPKQLGALFPSSRALARAMAKCALEGLNSQEKILELGAGTGRFTQALIEAGIPEHRLICIEIDPNLGMYLKKKFPKAKIVLGNACALEEALKAEQLSMNIGVVVSGLPMLNFPDLVQKEILRGCFKVLKSKGQFLQFTYSPFTSIRSQCFPLEKTRKCWVFNNFPPATIWSYVLE